MTQETKDNMLKRIQGFRLPRYDEIPNVGLYLEQVTKYIGDYLEPLGDVSITGSMISNYVKRGLVKNPVKKQYFREQIAYLIYIALTKNVLSLENIHALITIQRKTYDSKVAYDYFCTELENVLTFVFGLKDPLDTVGSDTTDEKTMLRNTIITVAHKTYLDLCFQAIRAEQAAGEG